MRFEFIELESFAAIRDDLFSDDAFLELQLHLASQPDAGAVIPGTGGCRKLRWAARGKGRRGGSRVIYFIQLLPGRIVFVTAYSKGELEDIPREWLRRIKEAFSHE